MKHPLTVIILITFIDNVVYGSSEFKIYPTESKNNNGKKIQSLNHYSLRILFSGISFILLLPLRYIHLYRYSKRLSRCIGPPKNIGEGIVYPISSVVKTVIVLQPSAIGF